MTRRHAKCGGIIISLCLTTAFEQAAGQEPMPPEKGEKQVVLETDLGTIVLEVYTEAAPRHVERFLQRVREDFYLGTTFHRAIPFGIIQGGDPLSQDPTKWDLYGTGGLNELEAEFNNVSHVRGTVSAVLVPSDPNSAGSQFFICVSDQTQLDGRYTAFARVVEGIQVVEKISQLPTDSKQRLTRRVEITKTYERERPPEEVPPFADTSVAELAEHKAEIYTTLGTIQIEFFPDSAPEHVRQFLRFAELGIYDGTTFHRVVPNFVIQGGAISSRQEPLPEKLHQYVKPLRAEFNERKHVTGAVSMARGDALDSAVDSFFIVLVDNPHLDGRYTVFGRVTQGLEVVDGISQVPLRGETQTPLVPVVIEKVTVRR